MRDELMNLDILGSDQSRVEKTIHEALSATAAVKTRLKAGRIATSAVMMVHNSDELLPALFVYTSQNTLVKFERRTTDWYSRTPLALGLVMAAYTRYPECREGIKCRHAPNYLPASVPAEAAQIYHSIDGGATQTPMVDLSARDKWKQRSNGSKRLMIPVVSATTLSSLILLIHMYLEDETVVHTPTSLNEELGFD